MTDREAIERELAEELGFGMVTAREFQDYVKHIWDALLSREIALRELRTEENYALDSRDDWKTRAEAADQRIKELEAQIEALQQMRSL